MRFDELTDKELAIIKVKCDRSLLFFIRFFYRLLRGSKFVLNWHHKTIGRHLEETAAYQYEFVNINIPPRHSKTEMVGVGFPAWSLSKNPRANFLYITASDELRSETSVRIRDIVQHPVYERMYGISIRQDQSAKNLWRTNQGGGLKTATIFGQITGFGAGRLVDKDLVDYIERFEGAIILDDINKIMDTAQDNALNQKALDVIFSTILSRKNNEETPIINIQQRTGANDATAVLTEHYQGKKMLNLVLPVIYNGEPLWPKKMDMEAIKKIQDSPYTKNTFDVQYMQDADKQKGHKFYRNYFEIIEPSSVPYGVQWEMYIDGAYGKKVKGKKRDPSGFMICGKHKEELYIKISIDKYLESPEFLKFIKSFHIAQEFPKANRIYIEPKASGQSLRPLINQKGFNCIEITHKYVNVSKEERADTALPFCEAGKIKLVKGAWNEPFLSQLESFPLGKHDEHIDLLSYAIIQNYIVNLRKHKRKITHTSQLGI